MDDSDITRSLFCFTEELDEFEQDRLIEGRPSYTHGLTLSTGSIGHYYTGAICVIKHNCIAIGSMAICTTN